MQKIERQKKFMNTTISINVVKQAQHKTIAINEAIEAAFGEFERIVDKFTRFNENSELANLNRRSGQWTQVSSELITLVEKMLKLARGTNGAYDPTIIDFLETYGYDKNYDFSKLDNPDLDKRVEELAQQRPSWEAIALDKANNKAKLAPEQRLDLGGIGKGYAIDCAASHLTKFENFMIDAGGDVFAQGTNEHGEAWKIGLKHQHQPMSEAEATHIGYVEGKDIALACSGSWARRFKQFHHLINPTTGAPSNDLQTVFVTASNATMADGWATALFIGGKELLENKPKDLDAMLISTENKVTATKMFPLSQ